MTTQSASSGLSLRWASASGTENLAQSVLLDFFYCMVNTEGIMDFDPALPPAPVILTKDEHLAQKLNNMSFWLKCLKALEKDKSLAETLSTYGTDPKSLGTFKAWYGMSVRPDMKIMGVKKVAEKLVLSYGLLVTDFTAEDMRKIELYLEFFEDNIRKE